MYRSARPASGREAKIVKCAVTNQGSARCRYRTVITQQEFNSATALLFTPSFLCIETGDFGQWRSQRFSGIRVQSVRYRLERLTKKGFTFPPPTGPRPLPHRKVTNDELLALARLGLSIPEIAAGLGMGMANAHRRITRLTKQGSIAAVPTANDNDAHV